MLHNILNLTSNFFTRMYFPVLRRSIKYGNGYSKENYEAHPIILFLISILK